MSTRIFGIKNCDTMKKAFAWFESAGVPYDFHDYKRAGVDAATLTRWCDTHGWEALVNTRGTTWRKLPDADKSIGDSTAAIALMQAQPSLIRRPVVECTDGTVLVGFNPESFARHCKA